ncbi:class I SAM-dependent methyltransferase [Crocosphaera sp. XPORK-15E]|uniref:class I SAM-dependent methyltransferase n=1 Tax=Crocosphaera sp. XPORK-15E TaxID=3110247 RepID=UPI002B20B373|nr:class I SAM-dependent methyltransferase [Crocosphaera sp. XPORK-15E]MEA5534776.1 class I SAM-dependent methyltransferase [Crocosphaera sp. XPORK-15E]
MKIVVSEDKTNRLVGIHPCFEGCQVYECQEQELGFTKPLPDHEQILQFYESGFYIKDDKLTGLEQRLQFSEQRALAQIDFIKPFLPEAKVSSVLDIGCSDGSLICLFSELNYRVTGYEPDSKMAIFAKERLKTKPGKSEIVNEMFGITENNDIRYDLVCSSHLFEHIANPIDHLSRLKQIMKEDGILFMEIPNQYGLGVKNCITPSIFPPATMQGHLYFYSPKSIRLVLEENGFKILCLKTCGKNVENFFISQKQKRKATVNIMDKVKKKIITINKYVKNRFLPKGEIKRDENLTNKSKSLFQTYWDGDQQGQWIRIIATPKNKN